MNLFWQKKRSINHEPTFRKSDKPPPSPATGGKADQLKWRHWGTAHHRKRVGGQSKVIRLGKRIAFLEVQVLKDNSIIASARVTKSIV